MPKGTKPLTPLDANGSIRPYFFDFGPVMQPGEVLVNVVVTSVISPNSPVADPNAAAVTVGPYLIVPSPQNHQPGQAVMQRFGNAYVSDAIYLVTANAITNFGNTPSVWDDLSSIGAE